MKNTCFFVTPIGDKGTDVRKNSDSVYKHILIPALSEEYDVKRMDMIDYSGDMLTKIFEQLRRSDIAVIDISGNNANVFYEYGFRDALGLPSITICNDLSNIPFDVRNNKVIGYSLHVDHLTDSIEAIQHLAKYFASNNYQLPTYSEALKKQAPEYLNGLDWSSVPRY